VDLIDRARRLHGSDGVLDDRLAGDLDQLIGDVEANPRTGSTCQDDGQMRNSRKVVTPELYRQISRVRRRRAR